MVWQREFVTVRKTLKWFLVLSVLLGLTGGAYGYWFWQQSDELLRQGVLKKASEIAPEWNVQIGRARFDWWGRHVHLFDVKLQAQQAEPFELTLPEITLAIDRDKLQETQQIDVQHVVFQGAQITVVRDSSGRWNWQGLPAIKTNPTASLPEVEVERANIQVRLEHSDGSAPTMMRFQQTGVRLIPSGKRQFRIQGATRVQRIGRLTFEADCDVNARTGQFDGHIGDLVLNSELINLATDASPALREAMIRGDQALKRIPGHPARNLPPSAPSGDVPDFGIDGTFGVDFRLARSGSEPKLEYAMLVDVQNAHVKNAALPFELHDVSGEVFVDQSGVQFSGIKARNGITQLAVDGKLSRSAHGFPGRFDVTAKDVILDDRLRSHFPRRWLKIYDPLRARGQIDVAVTWHSDGVEKWKYSNLAVDVAGCSGLHEKFAYPVNDVSGTVRQKGRDLELNFIGLAGRREAHLKGMVWNPGPEAEVDLIIDVQRLPLDETFVAACVPEGQKVLHALNLTGLATATYRLYRPPGLAKKFQARLDADVTQASMQFNGFPYRLDGLKGHVGYISRERKWSFSDLMARHGPGELHGYGTFSKQSKDDPGWFDLTIGAANVPVDYELKQALPVSLRDAWDMMSPTDGRLDMTTKLGWQPGQPTEISIPTAAISKAAFQMEPFPYPLENVTAAFRYANEQIDIENFSGVHEESLVGFPKGFVAWSPGGEWRAKFDDWHADSIPSGPNSPLRRALKPGTALRDGIEELNPKGPLTFSGKTLDLRGIDSEPDRMTAAWAMTVILAGNSLTAGLDVENIHGKVTAYGKLDEHGHLNMTFPENRIDLDWAEIWGYRLKDVRGPYRIDGEQVTLGSADALLPVSKTEKDRNVPLYDRITAKTIGGTLVLDAQATLKDQTPYHVKASLSDGNLAQYASLYLPSVKRLKGIVDGWVELSGVGALKAHIRGKGQVRIRQAALYELPVIVQVFSVLRSALSFVPTDNTAFRYAIADFTIANENFRFNPIVLKGDTIDLFGRGTVAFNEDVNLRFYSKMPDSKWRIPLINFAVDELTKGWVGVKVWGKISSPQAQVTAAPQIDDAMKQLFRSFNNGLPGVIPPLSAPPFGPPRRNSRLLPSAGQQGAPRSTPRR